MRRRTHAMPSSCAPAAALNTNELAPHPSTCEAAVLRVLGLASVDRGVFGDQPFKASALASPAGSSTARPGFDFVFRVPMSASLLFASLGKSNRNFVSCE